MLLKRALVGTYVLLCLLAYPQVSFASSYTFDFTFSTAPGDPTNIGIGTVTGVIRGLQEGWSSATSIEVQSNTSGYGLGEYVSRDYHPVYFGYGGYQRNLFNVQDGTLTSYYFLSFGEGNTPPSVTTSSLYMSYNWFQAYQSGMTNSPNRVYDEKPNPVMTLRNPNQFNPQMFLASVAGASSNGPSFGTSLARVVNINQEQYQNRYEYLIACSEDLNCDTDAYANYEKGIAEIGQDLGVVGVEVNNKLTSISINSAAVDTTTFDATLLGQILSYKSFVDKIKFYLQTGIDFTKEFNSPTSSQLRLNSFQLLSDPLSIESISGSMYWDADDFTSWSLSDLSVSVLVAKSYFSQFAEGQTFGMDSGLHPNAIGLGAFSVLNVLDMGEYNSVNLSFRHIDYFDPNRVPSEVPIPPAFPLLAVALSALGFIGWKVKRKSAATA